MKLYLSSPLLILLTLCPLAKADMSVTLKSKDGSLQANFPAGWVTASDLNESADIQAKNNDKGLYAVILADAKADLADTFDAYAEGRVKPLKKSLTDVKVDGPTQLQIGGKDAIRYELHGTFADAENKVKIGYIITMIQTEKYYIQVLTWGSESHFADGKDELAKIAENVKQAK